MADPKNKTWDSWDSYTAAFADLPDSFGGWSAEDPKWQGVRTLGDARKLAAEGWPAGMARAREVALPAVQAATAETIEAQTLTADVTGAAFDVGGYLTGEPEHWVRPDAVESKPCITILANLSASAGIPADMLEMRGAAVAALALALQTGGYAVKVYSCMGCPVGSWGGEASFSRVLLTDSEGGPLDVDRLVYGLAHPSALRMWAFCATTRAAGKDPNDLPHLEIPTDPPASLGWDCDLYLPAALVWDANWQDKASVEKWVLDQYRKVTSPKEGA